MKTENLRKYGLIILVVLFTSVSTANAQRFDRGERPHQEELHKGGKPGGEMKERGPRGPSIPNLTEEQKEQLHAFKLELDKSTLPLKNQVAEKEARLRTLTTAESFDERAVNKVIEEIGDLKTSLMKIKVANEQKVKSVLTEEQVIAFNNHMSKKGKGPKGQKSKMSQKPHRGR